jgi:hypothetical protein
MLTWPAVSFAAQLTGDFCRIALAAGQVRGMLLDVRRHVFAGGRVTP